MKPCVVRDKPKTQTLTQQSDEESSGDNSDYVALIQNPKPKHVMNIKPVMKKYSNKWDTQPDSEGDGL